MTRPITVKDGATAEAETPIGATAVNRRDLFAWSAGLGLATGAGMAHSGGPAFAQTAPPPAAEPLLKPPVPSFPSGIDPWIVRSTEKVVGLQYTDRERALLLKGLDEQIAALARLRGVKHDNSLAPASVFSPKLPGAVFAPQANRVRLKPSGPAPALPANPADIAFASAAQLGRWIRSGALTSRALTEIFLDRIARHAPGLHNFITVTPERARAEADAADRDAKAGRFRGPLHGVPYALKDLFDAEGIASTWGAEPYKNQIARRDSTVVRKLREAGAVLLGKTAVGALAYGDIWHDGVSRNPWNPVEGSSGSSAGSASAIAAGLCGFAIGTETLGSIISPSQRCGTTGLRPTFGRISRAGAMALCWSLDKVGPICRSVEDTALVLSVLNGQDPDDAGSLDHGFEYETTPNVAGMRVGHDPEWFSGNSANDVDRKALDAARALGVKLVPFKLPDLPYDLLSTMVEAEAAAAFAELTLDNQDDLLRWQDENAWPNTFRRVRFFPAVDYIQIDRLRRQVMIATQSAFSGVDAVLAPNFVANLLLVTNFTGHPCLCLRAGFVERTPRTLFDAPIDPSASPFRATHNVSVWANLYEERAAIRLGQALEARLNVASERPPGLG